MEKKKQIKISLGTAICIFIIVILILTLLGITIYYNKNSGKENVKNNNKTEEIELDIDENDGKTNKTEETELDTDEIAKELFEKAIEIKAVLIFDPTISVLETLGFGNYYKQEEKLIRIGDGRYTSTGIEYVDVENKFAEIFTGNELKRTFNKYDFLNVDGELYADITGGMTGWSIENINLERISQTDEEVKYKATFNEVYINDDIEKITCNFTIKKVNGEYRISYMDYNETGIIDLGYMQNKFKEFDIDFTGTWNTYEIDTKEESNVPLQQVLGSGYLSYGSKLILNEDGTFLDYIHPTISDEVCTTGTYKIERGVYIENDCVITLNYSNGKIVKFTGIIDEDDNVALWCGNYEEYMTEITLKK